MNRLKVRSTIGEHKKLTLSPDEIPLLCEKFRQARRSRKFTQSRVAALYNVTFQIISDWEHCLRITPFAEACMRDFIEADMTALNQFVDELQSMHYLFMEILPKFYLKSEDKLDKREIFMDKLYDMKLAFYSLKDFDKINLREGMKFYLDFDGDKNLISVLYYNSLKNYRDCLYSYYAAFAGAIRSINGLLRIYGSDKRLTVAARGENVY